LTPLQFKSIRAKLGLSQEEFGKKMGRGRAQIERYEKGLWPIPVAIAHFAKTLSTGKRKISKPID
jgi:transcriptional regulator with XRE-family HTH domain